MVTWGLQARALENWACGESFLSEEECDELVANCLKLEASQGLVGSKVRLDENVRKSKITWLELGGDTDFEWLYRRITDAVNTFNDTFWKFDLDYIEPLQFTRYDAISDHYGVHMDMGGSGRDQRKLSFSVQLSDPKDYKGGELVFSPGSADSQVANKDKGAITLFPSYMAHEVTKIKKGRRYSLVGWVRGPFFK